MALAQAAAYIRETNCSIAKYLLSYDTTWKVLMEDESHPDFALREYDYRSVYTTWDVSFEFVKQKNEDAAKMLQLWSCLDNKDIWYSLFNNEQNCNLDRWLSLPQWFARVMGNDIDFREAVRILLAYSLIEGKENSDAFVMHPVVHDWCRETLEDGSRHEFMQLAITVIGYAVPRKEERNPWELELRLLPHTSRCIALLDHLGKESLREENLLDLTEAGWRVGVLFAAHLKFAEAEAVYQWALESRKKNFRGKIDRGSNLTSRLHNSLGSLYLDQEKLDKAEAMFQRALTEIEDLSWSDIEGTMKVTNNLGLVYQYRGRLAEAEAMYKRALVWYTNTLGSDHVDTVVIVMNLGNVYSRQGNLTKAESSLKWALAVQEDKLGPEHPKTLMTIHNLGCCHQKQKKFGEAGIQFKRALSGREKILGSEHRDTLGTCYRLGDALFAQEKFVEAGVHFERVLSGNEKTLGSEHTDTLAAWYRLGQTLFAQGRPVEAEVQFERALSGYKKNKNYEWTKIAAVELSRTYEKQGRLAEAEPMLQQLLIEFEAALGPDHDLTLDVCSEMGKILVNQDDETKLLDAEAMLQRALLGYKKVQGLDHEFTAIAWYNLGLVLKDQGKLHEAEDIFQQALLGYRKVHGLDHEDMVDTQYFLGLVLKDREKLQEAEDMFQQALSGLEKIRGKDHEWTKYTANVLSEIYEKQGRRKEAKALYNQYHDTAYPSR